MEFITLPLVWAQAAHAYDLRFLLSRMLAGRWEQSMLPM
jgi:hypothetical protein